MKQSEIEALARSIAPLIERLVDARVKAIVGQVDDVRRKLDACESSLESIASSSVATVAKAVEEWMAAHPVRDGKDADPVDVSAVIDAVAQRAEKRIAESVASSVADWLTKHPPQKGEDGVGMAGGMIDREGDLIITTSKGETLRLGRVVGKDGADFTNVEIDYDGERTLIIRGQGGEIRKHLPIPLDRGYWRDGMTCQKGDVVTHDGSAWIALSETRERPGMATKEHWRMLARKGRDGRPPAAKIGGDDA